MKRIHWKWLLPIVQLALALACHVYDPHAYRVRARLDRVVDNMSYRFQHSPAIAGRISQGINFPALVLDYPLRFEANAIFERNSDYTLIWIAPKDIGFFAGIVLFWCWVGWKIDQRRGLSPIIVLPRKLTMAGLACGVAFGALTAAYAFRLSGNRWLPMRQIGACGIVWASALIGYFAWRAIQESGMGRAAKRRLSAVIATVVAAAMIWAGGPFGATQALGEYLRPTTVTAMPVERDCIQTAEPPPEKLMRLVDSYTASGGFTLQQVVVCRSSGGFPRADGYARSEAAYASLFFSDETRRWWRPLAPRCCAHQFRRHVTVVVYDARQNGTVIAEAALIQSRWDYLRLNLTRMRSAWWWPYPGIGDGGY
jgi:hypothetical protein